MRKITNNKGIRLRRWVRYSLLAITVLCIASLNDSCKKPRPEAFAVITVEDATGKRISGAEVHLHANGIGGEVEAKAFTDAAGQANFEFKLPAILNVDVTTPGGLTGTGIVKLESDETAEKTIIVS